MATREITIRIPTPFGVLEVIIKTRWADRV
jgi:hypothetical protein